MTVRAALAPGLCRSGCGCLAGLPLLRPHATRVGFLLVVVVLLLLLLPLRVPLQRTDQPVSAPAAGDCWG